MSRTEPRPTAWLDMVKHLRGQARHCAALGSPLYSSLLGHVADDVAVGGPCADVLRGHEDDPGPSALGLRLMGAVHRLVLERRAPELALTYPSVGGTGHPAAAWSALRSLLGDAELAAEIRDRLHQAPQTNEVGRAAALVGGLLHLAAHEVAVHGRAFPVRLVEIGASAGLNLRADHIRVEDGEGRGCGPLESHVHLQAAWQGAPLPTYDLVPIVARLGCDLAPVDLTSTEGRLTLTSFVWADQVGRLERLRGALQIAAAVPATVVRSAAADFLDRVQLVPGTTTVVWHSIMWQYVDLPERARVDARLAELAADAERSAGSAGFAHLRMEPGRRTPDDAVEVLVTLDVWPSVPGATGGRSPVLGTAGGHGLPTIWE